jgi:hypothetical protein
VIATNLALLDDEVLDFCAAEDVYLSTSVDGPRICTTATGGDGKTAGNERPTASGASRTGSVPGAVSNEETIAELLSSQ